MTTEQTLPITEFIDKSIDFAEFNSRISYTDWLSEVKSLEEAQQKKAKEEERERTIQQVVGILEKVIEDMDHEGTAWAQGKASGLQLAISSINL